jgi:hypothetical protein
LAFHTDTTEVPDPRAEATFQAPRPTWAWEGASHKAGLRRLYEDPLAARLTGPAEFYPPSRRLTTWRQAGRPLGDPPRRASTDTWPDVARGFQPDGGAAALLSAAGRAVALEPRAGRYHFGRDKTVPLEHLLPYECVMFGPASWDTYL